MMKAAQRPDGPASAPREKKMKLKFGLILALGAPLWAAHFAAAQDFVTQDYRFTANGPLKLLDAWTCWFPSCKYAACHMTTIKQPTLGRLTPRVGPTQIPAQGGVCAGQPVPGLTLTYTARAGAHGADEVVLRSIADNGQRHMLTFHIDVP